MIKDRELWTYLFDQQQLDRAQDYLNTHTDTNIARIIAVQETDVYYVTLIHCDRNTALILYLL